MVAVVAVMVVTALLAVLVRMVVGAAVVATVVVVVVVVVVVSLAVDVLIAAVVLEAGLVVEVVKTVEEAVVDDGLVVYDATTDRVHYLNATASLVLSLCDGRRTPEQLAALVGAAWRLADPPRAEVNGCIARLRSEAVIR